jgi:hypothetical protein
MDNDEITVCDKDRTSLTQRKVYLTLLAEEIRSYGVGYRLSELNLPSDLAIDYLKFNNTYWDIFETCLRNFDGMILSELNENYENDDNNNDEVKNVIIDIYTKQTKKATQEALDYIRDEVSSRERKFPIKIIENVHVHANIRDLLEKRAINKIERTGEDTKINDVIIKLREIPITHLNRLETKFKHIAKHSLMTEALYHAVKRARLDKPTSNKEEKDKGKRKYHFKKFAHSIEEIYNDLLLNSSNEDVKKMVKKSNAQIINEAARDYEIIDNPTYLHNKRKFKKAIGQHFRPKLKKCGNLVPIHNSTSGVKSN